MKFSTLISKPLLFQKYFMAFMEKAKISLWSFHLAWQMDKKVLLTWYGLSAALALLPALSLGYYQKIIAVLSSYLSTGDGYFDAIVPYIIALGVILIAIGLSSRVNQDLVYMMMYDSYYMGIQDMLIQYAATMDLEALQDRRIINEYNEASRRAASLTDYMSSTCELFGKAISVCSLLIVAFQQSKLFFAISLMYTLVVFLLNQNYVSGLRANNEDISDYYKRTEYYERICKEPNTAKEIRIFNCAEKVHREWNAAYDKIAAFETKTSAFIHRRSFLSGLVFYIFVICMISSAILKLSSGTMPPALLLTLFTLCTDIYTSLNGLISVIMISYDGLFFLGLQRNMFQRIPTKTAQKDIPMEKEAPVFQCCNVNYEYLNHVQALHDISFEIREGEVIALVGENGSGKTTLVKILLGLFKPTSGEVFFRGIPYDDCGTNLLHKHIGVYFQNSLLLHKSVYDNIGYGDIDSISDVDAVKDAIGRSGAESLVGGLKHGISTILGRRVETTGVELSGGEKQRIGIARAYMGNKDILIMDEPAAALDPIAELEQFQQIRAQMAGKTTILISHRIGFARMADRIIVMDHGIINEIGTHDQLMEKDGLYASMFRAQAQWYYREEETVI